MNFRPLIFGVERLERRLMLSLSPDAMPYFDAVATMAESAEVASHDEAQTELDVTVRSETGESGRFLVIELHNLDQPRFIGVSGGDLVLAQTNGPVHLPQPTNARLLELTVSNDMGHQIPFMSVELNEDGDVVNLTPLPYSLSTLSAGDEFHGTVDQLNQLHNSDAGHGMASQLTAASTGSMSFGGNHQVDVRSIDEAITHYGMAAMQGPMQYFGVSNHASMVEEVASTSEREPAEADSEGMHSGEDYAADVQFAMAMSTAVHSDAEAVDEEAYDAVLAGWEETIEGDGEAIAELELLASSIQVEATVPPREIPADFEQSLHAIAAVVEPLMDVIPEALPDIHEAMSPWPCVGGAVLAIACAAGVFSIERKRGKASDPSFDKWNADARY